MIWFTIQSDSLELPLWKSIHQTRAEPKAHVITKLKIDLTTYIVQGVLIQEDVIEFGVSSYSDQEVEAMTGGAIRISAGIWKLETNPKMKLISFLDKTWLTELWKCFHLKILLLSSCPAISKRKCVTTQVHAILKFTLYYVHVQVY